MSTTPPDDRDDGTTPHEAEPVSELDAAAPGETTIAVSPVRNGETTQELDVLNDAAILAVSSERDLPPTPHRSRGVLPAPDTALVQVVPAPDQSPLPRRRDAARFPGLLRDKTDREHRSRLVLLVPAAIFVLVLAGIVVVITDPSWFNALRDQHVAPPRMSTTTTSTPSSATGPVPTISTIQPDHAAPGQPITISGSGIISSNGSIAAFFGSEIASTRCPSESTCNVIVPSRPIGSAVVQLRLRTANGYSNSVPFRFS